MMGAKPKRPAAKRDFMQVARGIVERELLNCNVLHHYLTITIGTCGSMHQSLELTERIGWFILSDQRGKGPKTCQ
jgi:hypothetical protein